MPALVAYLKKFRQFLLAATIGASLPAWAALGGDIASVQADQIHMRGSLSATSLEGFTVHEIQTPTGIVVREYVGASGKVFGVAWQGHWPPDMRQLLGSYFEPYMQALRLQSNSRLGRRPIVIEQPGFVVKFGGHSRAFSGRAYIPELLPANVPAEAIQ